MSTIAKLTLLSSIAFTSGIVYWVVNKQGTDLESLHEGVIRDAERQAMKKQQNVIMFQEQADLTRALQAQRKAELGAASQQVPAQE